MSKHTPGPWKAVYVGSSDWDLDGPTTQEDWTLAAAAPDLLDALLQMFASIPPYRQDGTPTIPDAVVEIANAAIAKATGERT